MRNVFIFICLLLALAVWGGSAMAAESRYHIGPGDVLEISVWKDEGLSRERSEERGGGEGGRGRGGGRGARGRKRGKGGRRRRERRGRKRERMRKGEGRTKEKRKKVSSAAE